MHHIFCSQSKKDSILNTFAKADKAVTFYEYCLAPLNHSTTQPTNLLTMADDKLDVKSDSFASSDEEGMGLKNANDHEDDPDMTKAPKSDELMRDESENDCDGILERQSKHVARNPCIYLWSSFLVATLLSVIGLVVGEFSLSNESNGWDSRGTLIADRHMQLSLVQEFRDELATGDDAIWVELTTNVQKSVDSEDGDSRRKLQGDDSAVSTVHSLFSDTNEPNEPGFIDRRMTARYDHANRKGSILEKMMPQPDRSLTMDHVRASHPLVSAFGKEHFRRLDQEEDPFPGCDMSFYTSGDVFANTRLWPIWKTSSSYKTALNAEVLEDLCNTEDNTQKVLEDNNHCVRCDPDSPKCLPPLSIVTYARIHVDNGHSLSCSELAAAWEPLRAQTEALWKTCVETVKAEFDPQNPELPELCPFGFSTSYVDEGFDATQETLYTSTIFATFPSTKNIEDMYDIEDKFDRGTSKISGAYDTQDENFNELFQDSVLTRDMALALASAVIVALAVLVHTRSPLLTGIGLLQIIFSFPLAFFVYKLILGFDFFPFLNFIGLFVIFALGADDVFVAVDKWKNVRLDHPSASTEFVAAEALPDAASAMFLTTVTTAVAFFSTAICPVAPIKLFAIFCGLLVLFDYVMCVVLVFPTLCIYDLSLQRSMGGQPSCCISITNCFRKSGGDGDNENAKDDASREDMDGNGEEQHSLIHRALLMYFDAILKLRWVLFVASAAAFGVTTYYASTLELPTSSDVRLLPESHEFEKSYTWRQKVLYDQLQRGGGSTANVIWGVTPADTGDHNNPASWTTLELDSDFNAAATDAQKHLLGFCDDMFEREFAKKVSVDFECAINRFDQWLVDESTSATPSQEYSSNCGGAQAVPVAEGDFDACIAAWADKVGDTTILSWEGKVRIILFPFSSRVRYDDHYDDLDSEWNLIEDWMSDKNDEGPDAVNAAYFSSQDFWWYDTNGQMLTTAYGSAGIALGAAAIMLLLTTRSLVLTLFSTFTIAYVVVSVTATLVSLGWTLGFLESICFAILIGIACDFVLHFSHAYATLPGEVSREERAKYAVIKMGPSILAAAFTTMASACIMLGTIITFFSKFAVVLVMTVIQATAGTFIVFISLVLCIGPSNPTRLFEAMVSKCSGGDKETDADQNANRSGDSSGGSSDADDQQNVELTA